MNISINAEKLLLNPTAFNCKNTEQTSKRRGFPQPDKGHLQKLTENSYRMVKD